MTRRPGLHVTVCTFPGCRWAAVIGDRCATHDGETTPRPPSGRPNPNSVAAQVTALLNGPATCHNHPDRPVRARGLCGSCYSRAWRDGFTR